MPELPKYRSHKIVRGAKILVVNEWLPDGSAALIVDIGNTRLEISTKGGWRDRFKAADNDLGYYVEYEDGYQSWSPSKAFEEGYHLDDGRPQNLYYIQDADSPMHVISSSWQHALRRWTEFVAVENDMLVDEVDPPKGMELVAESSDLLL